MRRADRDKHAGLRNFETAEAVRNGYAVDGELGVNFGGDLMHFSEGHRFVGFVVQVQSRAAVGLIAYTPIEGDDSAVRAGANMVDRSEEHTSELQSRQYL